MRIITLHPHPSQLSDTDYSLHVKLEVIPHQGLTLCYILCGAINGCRIPATKMPAFAIGLWEHTCFEVFIALANEPQYHEFNFSPSSEWAAFAFSDIRKQTEYNTWQAPVISVNQNSKQLQLSTVIALANLPLNAKQQPLHIGLSAVLELNTGVHYYWALHHAKSHPDFHVRNSFSLILPPL